MLKGESLKSLLKELRWEKSVKKKKKKKKGEEKKTKKKKKKKQKDKKKKKKKKKKIGDVKKTGVSINSCLYHEYASIVTKIFKWFTKNPHIQK